MKEVVWAVKDLRVIDKLAVCYISIVDNGHIASKQAASEPHIKHYRRIHCVVFRISSAFVIHKNAIYTHEDNMLKALLKECRMEFSTRIFRGFKKQAWEETYCFCFCEVQL